MSVWQDLLLIETLGISSWWLLFPAHMVAFSPCNGLFFKSINGVVNRVFFLCFGQHNTQEYAEENKVAANVHFL